MEGKRRERRGSSPTKTVLGSRKKCTARVISLRGEINLRSQPRPTAEGWEDTGGARGLSGERGLAGVSPRSGQLG